MDIALTNVSSTAVSDLLIPAQHTLTDHHHVIAVLGMTHHTNNTYFLVVLFFEDQFERGPTKRCRERHGLQSVTVEP